MHSQFGTEFQLGAFLEAGEFLFIMQLDQFLHGDEEEGEDEAQKVDVPRDASESKGPVGR